jgi:flavodoxin
MAKKTLIICKSIHHGNTMKLARSMAEKMDAKIIEPSDFNEDMILDYDLIGFGSGIYGGQHDENLLDLADRLETQTNKKAFIFSTSIIRMSVMHKALRDKLLEKEFDIIGEFHCKGFTDYSVLKRVFGGIHKGRPNQKDLEKAKFFAKKLQEKS